MSNPPNPLSQYHTYSYHHILLACSTTKVAEALHKSNELVTFRRDATQKNTDTDPFGKYNAREVGDGRYIIVINGMEDADLIITDLKWKSVTAASAGSNGVDRFSTMTLDGSMVIDEPRGVKFMNIMTEVANRLRSDPNGIIFMIKTIFIGHTSSSVAYSLNQSQAETITSARTGDVYDPITNVRPSLFFLTDITGQFRIEGGRYNIGLIGVSNGASKQKHLMRAAQQISINFNDTVPGCEGRTLSGGLCRLQNAINRDYDQYFEKIKKEVESEVDSKGNKLKFNGKKVQYIIKAEYPYAIAPNNGISLAQQKRAVSSYVITDFKPQNTDKGKKDEAGSISFGDTRSIEQAIMKIVNRCSKIKEEAVFTENNTIGEEAKWVPKVVSTVETTETTYKVIFKLRRVLEARSNIIATVAKRTDDNINSLSEDVRRNVFTLDYIYTGKNTDILDFDIKMDFGLAFFQTLISTETIPSQQNAAKGQPPTQVEASNDAKSPTITGQKDNPSSDSSHPPLRAKTPIFYSTKFDDKTNKNTLNPLLSTKFQSLLNRHAALDNIGAKVKIHGNPGLLNSMSKQPSEVSGQSDRLQTGANVETDPFPFWETTPAIVKLNIKMPTDDQDGDYSLPFWYEGFYYCFQIENEFVSGEFTQTLEMMSLPQREPKTKKPVEKEKTEQEAQVEGNKTATTSAQNTGAGTPGAGAGGSGSTTTTTTTTAETQPTPADISPETMPASTYLKAFFKDQIIPKC